jgi:hypothetical protein
MKTEKRRRSTKAIKLLLVSSAFILQGCRPKKEDLPVPNMTPEQLLAQSALTEEERQAQREAQAGQLPVVQSMPQAHANQGNHSSWGFSPFFWGYGSGYSRSNNWSSSSSNRGTSSGFFSNSGSGPASHFGAQNSSATTASHSSSTQSAAAHSPTTHSSASHVASSPSVSRGGFGGHASASS